MNHHRHIRSYGVLAVVLAGFAALCGSCRQAAKPDSLANLPQVLDTVILISIDTLRPDYLGCYNPQISTTPTIDRLARGGVLFEDAYCNFPWTTPSHVTMLSGLYSWTHGMRSNSGKIANEVTLLSQILKSRGWRTGGFVSLRTLDARFGFDRGFDVYDDRKPTRIENAHFPERRGMDTVNNALRWLRQTDEGKVFLFLHLADPHGPYSPPEEYRLDLPTTVSGKKLPFSQHHGGKDAIPRYQRIGDHQEVEFYLRHYQAEINYVDDCLKFFLDTLRGRNILDRSLIVITADHGEAMGEHRRWFQHGSSLHKVQTGIPLIFHYPGARPVRVKGIAATVDITPTILDLLQLEVPAEMEGVSLSPRFVNPGLPGNDAWYGELGGQQMAIEKDGMKLMLMTENRKMFFDLAADPGEQQNLADETNDQTRGHDRAGELSRELADFVHSRQGHRAGQLGLTPEEETELNESLRALGYVE